MSLVEILVSTLVGSSLCLVMGILLAQSLRQGSTTQNEFNANCVAENVLEHTRALDFDTLKALGVGSKSLLVNRTTAGQVGPAIREEPVLLELQNLTYSEVAKAGKLSNAEVLLDVQSTSDSNAVIVVVTLSWTDSIHAGDTGGQKHTVVRSALINRFGSRYWG